ncbi:AAA family ATPase, partial [Micromonospora sp. MP36]
MAKARVWGWPALAGLGTVLVALTVGPVLLGKLHTHWPVWVVAGLGGTAVVATMVVKPLVQAHVKTLTDGVEAEGQRRQRQAEVIERVAGSSHRLPLVHDVVSRAALGIHPAIPLPPDADSNLSAELPSYVPRDNDADVQAAVTRMATTGGFLLLVRAPASGKTRAAAEAIRKLPQGWRMYLRSGSSSLQALVDEGVSLRRTVVWLDDIHELLDVAESGDSTGPQITSQLVRRLLLPDVGPVIVIGTTWPRKRDQYQKVADEGQPDLWADARRLLNMADQINL